MIGRTVFGLLAALCVTPTVDATSVTPELQKLARVATFEVVLSKHEPERVSYEKPLPVELQSYTERTDKYRSVGTAFALDDGTYVSAAHVMTLGFGNPVDLPLLRDAAGNVYAVSKVLKYSQREDYMVFSLATQPDTPALHPNTEPKIDEQVYAVGNALGQGVVIRDGLLTSETPEQQDGSWRWLRFSAPTSPGNSGGPLLDAAGNVIGLILAASFSENLNSALPVSRIMQGSTKAATFGTRGSFGLPMLSDKITVTMDANISLPKSYPDFAVAYRSALIAHQQKSSERLLASVSATLWPKGKSQKQLADTYADLSPKLIMQNTDGVWEARTYVNASSFVGDTPFLQAISAASPVLFHILRPDHAADAAFYGDSEQAGVLLAKQVRIGRSVGRESVAVKSLGIATVDTRFKDRFGRQWQLRAWPTDGQFGWISALMLPTPDGYAGIYVRSFGMLQELSVTILKQAADYFHVAYSGSLPQWQSFMSRPELWPASFNSLKLTYDTASGLQLATPRFKVSLPTSTNMMGERSQLSLWMNYILEGDRLLWDVSGMRLTQDWDKQTRLNLVRISRPGDQADATSIKRWQEMLGRAGSFGNVAAPNNNFSSFSIHTLLDSTQRTFGDFSPDTRFLYQFSCETDRQLFPRELYEMQRVALQGIRILEK